jgi:MYXO-CTERM domain-containing protein
MTVTNVQNGESGFNVNDFDATGLFTTTETTTQKLVVTNVTGDIFGGSYTLPTANSDDPYQFVETQNDNGNTVIGIFAGADSSNIGLTFNGQLVNWVIFESTANLPYVDPSTATSFADLFPVGTYSLTGQTGQSFTGDLTYNDFNSDLDLIPNSLTISVIPEPTSVGLAMLGLGGLALLRRRGNA